MLFRNFPLGALETLLRDPARTGGLTNPTEVRGQNVNDFLLVTTPGGLRALNHRLSRLRRVPARRRAAADFPPRTSGASRARTSAAVGTRSRSMPGMLCPPITPAPPSTVSAPL